MLFTLNRRVLHDHRQNLRAVEAFAWRPYSTTSLDKQEVFAAAPNERLMFTPEKFDTIKFSRMTTNVRYGQRKCGWNGALNGPKG
jgi:hypothetical protein